jgi:hypothetical protein
MLVIALSGESAFFFKQRNNFGIRLEDIFADKSRQSALLGVATVVIDRREQVEWRSMPRR